MAIKKSQSYAEVLKNLKEKIRLARLRASFVANSQLLSMYWEIGNILLQQKSKEEWGTKIINRLAVDLHREFPEMKGISERNLVYMQTFASTYPDFNLIPTSDVQRSAGQNTQPAVAQLQASGLKGKSKPITQPAVAQLQQAIMLIPWSHNLVLLDKLKDNDHRLFYARKTLENGWSRNVLIHQIEKRLHKRQGKAITNFDKTLAKGQSDLAKEIIKNPYLFDFLGMTEDIQELELEKALIDHITKFLLELGAGFAFIGRQHHLEVGGEDYYLDLLFYHTRLHCYVVVELKTGKFIPEFAGKLNFYLSAVDTQIKSNNDQPSIGILICKEKNKVIAEYSLPGVDKPIGVNEYKLTQAIPKKLKGSLPTIEEIEKELKKK